MFLFGNSSPTCEPSKQQGGGSGVEEGFGRGNGSFKILGQAAVATGVPNLSCTALAAQFMPPTNEGTVIALFGFQHREGGTKRVLEKHYRLVPPKAVTD